MIENPNYTLSQFMRDGGYTCDQELEAWDSYYEQVMVCCECEKPATLLHESGSLTCEAHSENESAIVFANFGDS